MNLREKHYFDLDGTLWETNARSWIIDKLNPSKPIMKIDMHEFNLLHKGYYVNDGHKIDYNGMDFWLSNEILTKIKTKKPIEIDRIGISVREFNNEFFINGQLDSIKFMFNRLTVVPNLKSITLLTARSNIKAHLPLISKLEEELNKINIKLDGYHLIHDLSELKNNNTGDTSTKKLIKLIQSLIGFKIEDNKFVALLEDEQDIVHFYDDEDKNINICNDINEYIMLYLSNSSEVVKKRIMNKKLDAKKLITYLVTSNEMNPFIKKEINIQILSV